MLASFRHVGYHSGQTAWSSLVLQAGVTLCPRPRTGSSGRTRTFTSTSTRDPKWFRIDTSRSAVNLPRSALRMAREIGCGEASPGMGGPDGHRYERRSSKLWGPVLAALAVSSGLTRKLAGKGDLGSDRQPRSDRRRLREYGFKNLPKGIDANGSQNVGTKDLPRFSRPFQTTWFWAEDYWPWLDNLRLRNE